MEHENALQNVMDLILNTDDKHTDPKAMYQEMQPYLHGLAEWLHIGKLTIKIVTAPNVYEINGDKQFLSTQFFDDLGPEEDVYRIRFGQVGFNTGDSWVYPRAGHQFDDQEKYYIEAIAKLMAIEFSRSDMIRHQMKTPFIDMLTGLANNAGVAHYGERLSKLYSMEDYAGVFINLKNFKYINEQVTQAGGDQVLRQYAYMLYGYLDGNRELVARLGGDNFFALVRKDHLDQFLNLAGNANVPINRGGKRSTVTVNTWMGVYPARAEDQVMGVLNFSNFALGQARRSKQPVAYFDPKAMEQTLHFKGVSQTLPEAIKKRELVPFYQPKVRLSNGELYGCEALVRWYHDGEFIPPSEFVPVAENSGLVTTLDLYMLDCVCRDLRSWLDAGIEPVPVSVNYSPRDFYVPSLVQETLRIVQMYDLDGKYLEIEITESTFLDNFSALENFVSAMHASGIRVSLDDFGTGYSSLNMFKNLDLDTVKLDKSFFDNLADGRESDRIVLATIADMINKLNKVAVSEGVETLDQCQFVREIGCDIIQGYYFDKPLGHDDFTARLKAHYYGPDGKPLTT